MSLLTLVVVRLLRPHRIQDLLGGAVTAHGGVGTAEERLLPPALGQRNEWIASRSSSASGTPRRAAAALRTARSFSSAKTVVRFITTGVWYSAQTRASVSPTAHPAPRGHRAIGDKGRRQAHAVSVLADLMEFTAPCPCGNPDALWRCWRQCGGEAGAEHLGVERPAYRVECGWCDPAASPSTTLCRTALVRVVEPGAVG